LSSENTNYQCILPEIICYASAGDVWARRL
jgi:hypothetical protein